MADGRHSPFVRSNRFALLLAGIIAANLLRAAQEPAVQFELNPNSPTAGDVLTFKLSGTWRDGCVPQSPVVAILSGIVRIRTSNAAPVCTQALTPWTLTGTAGKLAAGDYLLVVEYSGANDQSPVEIGRKALMVTGTSARNEVVLTVVVNGSFAEKLHYQTIFTILNASRLPIQATLQVYSNLGKPVGAFCAPIAPAPSSTTSILSPGAESFQYTSADLPFLDGWALLQWEGSPSVLAAEELTLVAAAPQACLLVCNRPSTEKLSSTQLPAIRPAKEFRHPATFNAFRQTALAVINPSAVDTARVRISLFDASGKSANLEVPGNFEIKIPPLQRVSKFLWQMALESSALTAVIPAPESFQGSVVVTSDVPIAVGAMHIMFPQGKFVAIPGLITLP